MCNQEDDQRGTAICNTQQQKDEEEASSSFPVSMLDEQEWKRL